MRIAGQQVSLGEAAMSQGDNQYIIKKKGVQDFRLHNPAKSMRKTNQKVMLAAAACFLLGTAAVGGTMAYLTDADEETNTFTIGEVEVDLTEPDYPGDDSEDVRNLVPNQEVVKNPQVTNTGVNEALVFMTVTVPVDEITVVSPDGTKGEKSAADLFWFKDTQDSLADASNHWDESWIMLTEKETFTNAQGTAADNLAAAADGSHTYVFAYESAIANGAATSALFDKVQLKNVIEHEIEPESAQNIVVKAYAIQSAEIVESGNTDLTDTLDETSLGKIYDIYLKQNEL